MQTFKHFLAENDLDRLHLELFLQQQFDLTKSERVYVAEWVEGDVEDFDTSKVWDKVYSYYCDEMPYDIAKGDATDWDTEAWVYEMVLHDLKDAGIETRFKPDGQHRPRNATQPMPGRERWLRDDDF